MKLPQPERLRIHLHPDPVLRKVAKPVTEFPPELAAIARRMLELMRREEGVGLAAPQVGLSIRLFVCNVDGDAEHDLVCINPTFLALEGAEEKEEGCLSLPSVKVLMRRATHAAMEACDLTGRTFRVEGEGLAARVWQHETDHLDGRLIIDNMSATDEIANRRALKQLKKDHKG